LDEELVKPAGYHTFWCPADRPGYSGTALYTRDKPDEVWRGLGKAEFNSEGRVIAARFGNLHIISAYFPNSQPLGARLDYKIRFCDAFTRKMKALVKKGQEVVLTGDYNIAHTEIDLARPKQNEESPGYFPQERKAMDDFLKAGFVDIFREQHPGEKDQYTWWSFRGAARQRNVGWRIDYTNISPGLRKRTKETFHQRMVFGSDHCPVGLVLK
jgi:exodeoxyribonuclease-3